MQPAVHCCSTEQLFWSKSGYLRVVEVAWLISLPGDFNFNLCHCRKHLVVLAVP